jgi:hypothetical protein
MKTIVLYGENPCKDVIYYVSTFKDVKFYVSTFKILDSATLLIPRLGSVQVNHDQ